MFTQRRRNAISAVIAVLVVLVLVLGAATAYFAVQTPGSTKTVTSTVGGSASTVTVGAGVTVTNTVTNTVSGSGSSGLGNLTALAKAEGGTLTIYGLLPTSIFSADVQAPFNAIYPWVNINYISTNTGGVLSKVSQEESAGHVVGDIVSLPPQAFLNIGQGNLTCWNNPSMQTSGWPSNTIPAGWGCYLSPFQSGLVVIAYNTKLMTAANAPTSWLDLANSKYNGIDAIWTPTAGSSWIAQLDAMKYTFNMSSTSWQAYLTGIANTKPVAASDFGSAYTDMSTGGASICVCQMSDVAGGLKSGAPVAIDWNVPQIYQFPNFLAMPKGAPQPYTAQLFMEWAAGYGGQSSLAQGTVPMFPGLLPTTLAAEGITIQGTHTFVSTVGPGYMNLANYTAANAIITGIMG